MFKNNNRTGRREIISKAAKDHFLKLHLCVLCDCSAFSAVKYFPEFYFLMFGSSRPYLFFRSSALSRYAKRIASSPKLAKMIIGRV